MRTRWERLPVLPSDTPGSAVFKLVKMLKLLKLLQRAITKNDLVV